MSESRRDAPLWVIPPFLFLVAVLLLVGLTGCRRSTPSGPITEDVLLATADGVEAPAVVVSPIESAEVGLVLVHGKGEAPGRWSTLAQQAALEGMTSIAVELRKPEATPDTESHGVSPWVLAGYEIEAAFHFLAERGIPRSQIALVASGVGGNLAVRYGAQEKDVAAVVLISPGLDYENVAIDGARRAYAGALMMLYTTGDAYAASSARSLYGAAPGLTEVREYQGGAHGMDLIEKSDHARNQILHWIPVALGLESEVPAGDSDYVPEWARSKK